jgi:hypothetical protein
MESPCNLMPKGSMSRYSLAEILWKFWMFNLKTFPREPMYLS